MTHSPADVLQYLLIDEGLGSDPDDDPLGLWPVYCNGEPGSPDQLVTVYDTTGMSHGRVMVNGELQGPMGFQVRVRAKDHATGWMKTDNIRTSLAQQVYQKVVRVDSSIYLVHAVVGIGNVLPLGTDAPNSKRHLFTVNAMVHVKQTA